MKNNPINTHCCKIMSQHLQENEVAVAYLSKFREYGIRILDGGSSLQKIAYCPWCGTKLPTSLRDEWFEMLGNIGIDPASDDIPSKYCTDEWWLNPSDLDNRDEGENR